MSKKRLIICIVVSMLILALFGLTACGNPTPGGIEGEGENPTPGGIEGEDGKVSISGGTNSVNTAIQEAKATNGVLVTYTITSGEGGEEQTSTVTFGANGEKYYFLIDGQEIIYDLSGSTGMDVYTKETTDTLWTKSTTPYTQMSKQQATAAMNESYTTVAMYMTSYSLHSAQGAVFVKAGTEEISGHTCTKYKYTASLLGASVSTIYWVEDSTGICFKVGYEGNVDGEETAASLILSQYNETYTVPIPTQNQIVSDSDCNHVDADNDGYCDECDEPYEPQAPGTITLNAPVVELNSANGLASWNDITGATGYICKVNGVEKAKQTGTTIQLNNNDTLQVKSVGDGATKRDSGWSAQVLYKTTPLYDFSNLGLSTTKETLLKRYEEAEAGFYEDFSSDTYKCTNGDIIIDDCNSFIEMFSRINGYTKLTVVYHYSDNNTTDYKLVDYKDNKKAYYEDLYYALYLVNYIDRAPTVYADYHEFIEAEEYALLDYNEYNTDDITSYELVSYTEYSGDFDGKYLNTKYMHPSRSYSYLEDYSSKITSWTVDRVNIEGKNYSDSEITIKFNEDFTDDDYLALLTYLHDEYALAADEDSSFSLSGSSTNTFKGIINVYDFPYEEEGGSLADEYKLTNNSNNTYTLTVHYIYSTYFDGGTFATYVTTPNGLFRIFEGSLQLMIAPDGTVQEHILAPYKTLTDFEVSYTLNAENDAENEAEGYFVNTYTVKKVGDYILLTTVTEYDTKYTVYRIKDKKLFYREGYTGEDSAVEWGDFNDNTESYYSSLTVYGELINQYFTNQLKCTETGSATVAGESCTTYTREDNDNTYTYYANTEGITLRYVKETKDGEYVSTKELKSYDDSVSSFTALEQGIIDDSGISAYNGEE